MKGTAARSSRPAFTLLETLVVAALLAVLVSILVPVSNLVRGNLKSLQCASNMRTITQRFELFVHGNKNYASANGRRPGQRGFPINDFQDQLYGIDKFWNLGTQATGQLSSDLDLMLCPAGPQQLIKKKDLPCDGGAIGPLQDVSLGLNMRLYRAPVVFEGAMPLAAAASTRVVADILNHPYVPLVLDVDATEAVRRGNSPFYVAPPIDGVDDGYATGDYWTPSRRHGGHVNVGFVGGHVLKSQTPELERWDWKYNAGIGR